MKKYITICLLLFLFIAKEGYSTHNVAGQITYLPLDTINSPCLQYEITVTTYTDMTSQSDRCSLTVDFGDGTSAVLNRVYYANQQPAGGTNGFIGCSFPIGNGVPVSPVLSCFNTLKKNEYIGVHAYAGPGSYVIRMKDPNNAVGICNIVNSVNVQFVLQSLLVINAIPGGNTSAFFNAIPVGCACANTCFYYQPNISFAPGDSTYCFLASYTDTTGLPYSGYSSPPVGTNGWLWINPATGDIEWCSPPAICRYDLCIRVNQWKTVLGKTYYLGYSTLVMQVVVSAPSGTNPCSAGISESSKETMSLNVYPNPASGDIRFVFNVASGSSDNIAASLEISDLTGRCLRKIKGPFSEQFILSKGQLPAGTYFYTSSAADKKRLFQGKFLVLP